MTTTHYRILAILWTLGIAAAYSIPISGMPVSTTVIGWDKLAHFGLFCGFGFLWMHALHPSRSSGFKITSHRWAAAIFGVGVALSVLAEVYQDSLPYRSAEPYDALANMLGLSVALLFFYWRHPPTPRETHSKRAA